MKSFLLLFLSIFSVLPLYSQHTQHLNREIKQFEAQKVESRKIYFGNIMDKVTKVVLSGDNSMTDLIYKNAVQKGWYISPFEFCSYEEFDRIKCDTNYCFLMRIKAGTRKNEDVEMEFLTYVKGDKEASEGIEKMPEILSLPISPEEDREGRIFTYFPAYINIFQCYIDKVARGIIYPSIAGLITEKIDKPLITTIYFRKDDFSFPVTKEYLDKKFKGKAKLVTQEEIDEAIREERPNTLVSLVVAHPEPIRKTYCYKMLISTDTYDLYYYKKHKISKRKRQGFKKSDLRSIAMPYKAIK